ncbi:MAG: ribonuclease P protein component [Calditrichaeota bacterium]|nr:MAG: ribonuclease P protein component [Calditrichota bacterium]
MNLSSQPKITSLKSKKEIARLFNKGIRKRFKYGVVILRNDPCLDRKAGVFVKKHMGNAVYRNYLKRIVRHYIRENATLLSDYSRVLFLINKKNEHLNFHELCVELNWVFIKK